MAETYETFYPGLFRPPEFMPETAYSDLFVGYRIPAAKLGATTSIQTANQLAEVSQRLSTGMKVVEAQPLSTDVFQKIPKEHFKEINRLSKLTGAEVTWHAPIIDPAGMTEEGKVTEHTRKINEDLLWDVTQKAIIATGGGQPITIHATAGIPPNEIKRKVDGKEEVVMFGVANKISETVGGIKPEDIIKPEEIEKWRKAEEMPVEEFLREKNREEWINILEAVERRKVDIEPLLAKFPPVLEQEIEKKESKLLDSYVFRYLGKSASELSEKELSQFRDELMKKDEEARRLFSELEIAKARAEESELLFKDLSLSIDQIFRIAWKVADDEQKKKLMSIASKIKEAKESFNVDPQMSMTALTQVFKELKDERMTPQMLIPAEDFAREKASETLSNLAMRAFEKFKDKAPILSVENIFPEMAFSRAESLKKLVEESRRKFVEKTKDKLGEEQAKKIAEKLIGVTWDIGHINLLKKYGYTPEEIKAELEKIKPFVKHFHLTDNFGFTDSHLPPGMGGIPREVFKDISELIKEKGLKAAVEAATMALPHPYGFGVSPYPYALAALGSPMYSYLMAPFWNQALARELPAYFTGYGPILPEQHFSMYGAGFTGLPSELGGQLPGKGFSEKPME